MKTQISFRSLAGGQGVALVNGLISNDLQAKNELANFKNLPLGKTNSGQQGDIDSRLKHGDIDPDSITFMHISE